jgi:hypothetical protein
LRRRAFALAVVACLAAAAALAPTADAHGLAGRADLPIPVYLFGWGAAAVLVLSFAGLALLWPEPRLQEPTRRRLWRVARWIDPLCGAIGIFLFGMVVYSGLAGSSTATSNFTPTFVYVIFWVGLVPASVLFGDVFRAFNPWRALARATAFVAEWMNAKPLPAPLPYPRRLGRWPAVLGILAFAWLELVYSQQADPATLALLAIAYASLQLVGMALYGIERWSDRGDAFGVYFNLFSRLSVFERRHGLLHRRTPLAGVTGLELVPGTVALLAVMIGTTSFDGFSSTSTWQSIAPHLESFFGDVGAGRTLSNELAFTLGLAFMVGVIGGAYRVGIHGMHTVGDRFGSSVLRGRFVHSLVPIAVAYVIAHYFSLLVYQGQAIYALASDPLGHGSDLFGTAHRQIDYGVISSAGIWYVQVVALVAGHVAGLVLAHDRALAMYHRARDATRSQYWMLAVMIGFTSLGLWLLASLNG